jgi:hypothetical protein
MWWGRGEREERWWEGNLGKMAGEYGGKKQAWGAGEDLLLALLAPCR